MRKMLVVLGLLGFFGCQTAPETGHAVHWHLQQGYLHPGMTTGEVMHYYGPPYDRRRTCVGQQHVQEWIYKTHEHPEVSVFFVDERVTYWQVKNVLGN